MKKKYPSTSLGSKMSDYDFFMSLSNDTSLTIESFSDLPSFLRMEAFIHSTIAGKMALRLHKSKNKFSNYNAWKLYGDIEDVDDWRITPVIESHLAFCMVILEMENILSLEATGNLHIPDDVDFTKTFQEAQINYRKEVIKTCYKKGRFETDNWWVEVCPKKK